MSGDRIAQDTERAFQMVTNPKAVKPAENELTEIERARLAELEPVVKMGMANFVVVGKALLEISDSRLYRERYSTFKEYVETEHEISARRAYQLCEAADVVKSLPANVQKITHLNEAQARTLGKSEESERPNILKAARKKAKAEHRPMVAKDIEVEAEKVAPQKTDAERNDEAWKAATGGITIPNREQELAKLLAAVLTVLKSSVPPSPKPKEPTNANPR